MCVCGRRNEGAVCQAAGRSAVGFSSLCLDDVSGGRGGYQQRACGRRSEGAVCAAGLAAGRWLVGAEVAGFCVVVIVNLYVLVMIYVECERALLN